MPDIWYDVDTALAEVPVNILPLIDDTDFKAIEGAVAYNAGGLALRWHFVTCAGAYTVTSVTPTTGGAYDWTDQGDSGIYTIEIPASGGASINNDTEGFGWFTGVATGILPWRGPTIGFRAAALNDALIESAWSETRGLSCTALPAVAAGSADGLILGSAANKLAVDAAGKVAVPDTQKVDINTIKTQTITCAAGVTILASVGTAATATAQTGDVYALANGASGFVAIKGETAAILADTGTDGVVVAAASKTGYTLTATTGLGNQTANINGSVASVTGAVGSVAAGGIASTSFAAGAINAAAIADAAIDNATFAADVGSTAYASNIIALAVRKVLDELNLDHLISSATPIDGKSWEAAVRYALAILAGKVSGAGSGTESFFGLDGTTERVRVTAEPDGDRSAVNYDPV